MIGKRVDHKFYGKGVVQESRYKGLFLKILFDDGLIRIIRKEDVRFLSDSPSFQTSYSAITTKKSEDFRSRSMIEAFRLGIVPYGNIENFTFGRDDEIKQLKEWLNNKDIGTLIIEGEYGSGKTHILDYLYALAMNHGYAVTMTELDPNESPPFKPRSVYRKLIKTFRFKDEEATLKGFRDFVIALAERGKEHLRNHQYFRDILKTIGTIHESEQIWDWIEGRESFWRASPPDHGTAANIYCNIIGTLSWGACEILKLKGLLVILDEAENVGIAYGYQIHKGGNFLYGLAMLASDDNRLANERIVKNYESGIGSCIGKETNLIYHGRAYDTRYCFRLPSFLKVAFAFTPTYFESTNKKHFSIYEKIKQLGAKVINVEPLSESALKEAFEHICLLYSSSYDFLESDSEINRCYEYLKAKLNSSTRSFIKGAVEILDIRRFHKNISLNNIE